MIIKIVIEDSSEHGLATEHGLCLWIEACGRRFFCDLGQTGLFADNAARLGIRPEEAEFAVISHGHYDHGGGIPVFLLLNASAPVYVHENAFSDHYSTRNGQTKYIGLPHNLQAENRIKTTDGTIQIADGIALFTGGCGNDFFSPANRRILKRDDSQLVCDDFCHEQSLLIREGDNNVLIASCAHSGILNIIRKAEQVSGMPVTHVVAGMHMSGVTDSAFIEGFAEVLKAKNCRYYTFHCTGREFYDRLKPVMGQQISYLSAGDIINIGEA